MKSWRLLISLLFLLGTLAACVPPPAPSAAAPADSSATEASAAPAEAPTAAPARTSLVVAVPVITDNLDAHQTFGGGLMDMEQIGQALMRIDNTTGELISDLAESWTWAEDGLSLTITLPADAKFSNGDPLDAQSLKDSWFRYKEISPYGSDMEALVDMEVVDSTTAVATFSAPPAALYAVLETAYGAPWDIAQATAMGDEAFALAPVGSGPLVVTAFTPQNDVLMVRNDNYHTNLPFVENKGPIHLTEVQVRAIAEEMTLAGELETGTVDVILNAPVAALDRLRANPDIQLFEVTSPGYTGLVMNHQSPFFSDLLVRQAVAQALDRESLSKVLGDVTAPQYAFVNESMLAYSAEADSYAQGRYPHNVEAAQATLAEAGWVDGDGDGIVEKEGEPFSVEMIIRADDTVNALAGQVLQAQLKAIGIDLQLSPLDRNAARDTMSAGEYQMGFEFIGWRDPDIFSLAFGLPFWNFSKYENPEALAELEAARHILNPAERSAAYGALQQLWLDDVVELPLWQNKRFVAARSWVKGLIVNPTTGFVHLNDVTIEE